MSEGRDPAPWRVIDLGFTHIADGLRGHQLAIERLAGEGYELVCVSGTIGYFRHVGEAREDSPEEAHDDQAREHQGGGRRRRPRP